jgi:hypothetical protein
VSTSTQALKKESERRKASAVGAMVKSEMYLNRAFDGLNRCELRGQSVSSELGGIIASAVRSGIEVYNQAHLLHEAGRYQLSQKHAEAVYRFCILLNNLAEEQADNILRLPLPPQMHLIDSKKASRPQNLHPALNTLDSFIRRRMMRASKLYKGRLFGYVDILSQISKQLKNIESYH